VSFNYALSDLVLPPTSLVLLALAAVLLLRRRRALALTVIVVSQLALLALSMPVIANALLRTLEPPPLAHEALRDAQAIVVLGGGRNRGAPEYGGETVNDFTLARLRYGARLARASGLPLYVTGGKPSGGIEPEGSLMRDLLDREFGVPVRWVDNDANTTRENAQMAARDLAGAEIRRIALVTDAMHMPRSARAFAAQGFHVIPAATGYAGQRPFAPYQLVPGAKHLWLSQMALREWASQLVYRLRGG
jgi:uncharacterized SAM-binding protein YcdF (DUF218 family)